MITLYQFTPLMGLPNASPFCMKLELYLRLAGLEHKVVTLKGLRGSPTGKAPYIDIDGEVIADSGLIINRLEAKFGHPVDGKLTLAERGQSLAFQRMMEEHLYWVAVYMRWVDPGTRKHWEPHMQKLIGLPGFLTPLVSKLAARGIGKVLHGQGIGRHAPETIWRMGIADIQALAHWLGNRTWAFGDAPTTLDSVMAAFIGNIARTPWDNPLTAATLKHGTLVAHFERVMARCFPELAR